MFFIFGLLVSLLAIETYATSDASAEGHSTFLKKTRDITWSFEEPENILRASGSGNMEDYSLDEDNLSPYYGDYYIDAIEIEEGISSIGSYFFYGCTSVKYVKIPSTVTSIGEGAFANCWDLTNVTIPANVTSIGHSVFAQGRALESINVDPNNTVYKSPGGVLYNMEGTDLIQYPCGKDGSYSIPDDVKSIQPRAFAGCWMMKSVNISSSVESIGEYAFEDCNNLTSLNIPSSVETIGEGVLTRCQNLVSIDVSQNNTNYKSENGVLFNSEGTILIQFPGGKEGSYDVPDNVTTLLPYSFSGCTQLISVTMPSSVTAIGVNAFEECKVLKAVSLSSGLTSIEKNTFKDCRELESITIPPNVTTIGDNAFHWCSKLSLVIVSPNLISIGVYAFSGCNFSNFTFPPNLTSIGDYAFYWCKYLTSITFHPKITYIGFGSFGGCSRLGTVLYHHSSITGCSQNTFYYSCTYMKVWVPINYTSNTFCGKKVYPTSPQFDNLRERHNECYEVLISDKNDTQVEMRPEVSEWVNRSNECIEYQCIGGQGIVTQSICNDTPCAERECISDKCVVVKDFCSLNNSYPMCFDLRCNENGTCSNTSLDTGNTNECVESRVCTDDGWKDIPKNCTAIILGDVKTPPEVNEDTIDCYDVKCHEGTCSFTARSSCGLVCNSKAKEECKRNLTNSTCMTYKCLENVNSEGLWVPNCEYVEAEGKQELLEQENSCFMVDCDGEEWILRKRDSVALWENRSDKCIKYTCDNSSGLSSKSLCTSTDEVERICIDGRCEEIQRIYTDEWIVEIEVEGIEAVDLNTTELLQNISSVSNIDVQELRIATEIDDKGRVVRILVFVKDEETAQIVETSVKNDSCSDLELMDIDNSTAK